MSKYNRKRKIQDDDRQDNKISKPNEDDDLNSNLFILLIKYIN